MDSTVSASSLMESRMCDYEAVAFGPDQTEMVPHAACLRGECSDCEQRNDWLPTLTPEQSAQSIRWTEYMPYEVLAPTKDDPNKTKTKLREVAVSGTGAELLAKIEESMQSTGVFPHKEQVIWQANVLKAKQKKGFFVRLDYGSRLGIGGQADPLSTGINPDQIGTMNCCVDRAWDPEYDRGTDRPESGRVQDRCTIAFDYVPGRDKQNANSTEAALELLLFKYALGGFTLWEEACYIESDGCCAQFWCKERFAWNDTWVNPFGARGRPANAPPFVLPELGGEKTVADLMMEQSDLPRFIQDMKAFIGLKLLEHNRGAARHGKSIVDAIGHLFNSTVQKGNIAPLDCLQSNAERAKDAESAVAMLLCGGV